MTEPRYFDLDTDPGPDFMVGAVIEVTTAEDGMVCLYEVIAIEGRRIFVCPIVPTLH